MAMAMALPLARGVSPARTKIELFADGRSSQPGRASQYTDRVEQSGRGRPNFGAQSIEPRNAAEQGFHLFTWVGAQTGHASEGSAPDPGGEILYHGIDTSRYPLAKEFLGCQ
jgi:hypothetical protein